MNLLDQALKLISNENPPGRITQQFVVLDAAQANVFIAYQRHLDGL